jgi:GAF domain-containing protein
VGSVTVSRTIIGQAVREGQAILSADPLADERFDPSRSIAAQGISSAVCAPIRIGGGFGGVLSMDRRRRPVAFGNADLRVVATMAGILSLFLEKERLQIEARQKTESDGTGHAP